MTFEVNTATGIYCVGYSAFSLAKAKFLVLFVLDRVGMYVCVLVLPFLYQPCFA